MCRDGQPLHWEPLELKAPEQYLKPIGTPGGEKDAAAKPHLLCEHHDPVSDLQPRITDRADAMHQLLEGFGESPGGKGSTRLIEVGNVLGSDG